MRIALDIECNALVKPDKIWVICCKDIDSGEYHIFREGQYDDFLKLAQGVKLWVGHNFLGYDFPVLVNLLGLTVPDVASSCIDTLIVSKLVDYSRVGHSIEAYGIEFNFPKGSNYIEGFFSKWSQELEDYCIRDVEVCRRIYTKYLRIIDSVDWQPSIRLEHQFQLIVNSLHTNGFSFNVRRATDLLRKVKGELHVLDEAIEKGFPPRLHPIKEIHPRLTLHGTLNRSDFRWVKDGDLSAYNGGPFTRCEWQSFNPSSHKQIIEVLSTAGWSPTDKTQTHIDTERELNKLKYSKNEDKEVDLSILRAKLLGLEKTGWKINENNLTSLPASAPAPARTLAKRIIWESRRRTLTEWLGLVPPDTERVHGSFYGIGAWTHRMAHQRPNTANIPNEFKEDGSRKLLGKELRSLWQAPRNRLLVGVDAEGIQLRIFAHYIDDKEFTDALVRGNKADKTDPHSLNHRILGEVCKGRQQAKRFVYALLLGAGLGKLAEILGSTRQQAEQALGNLLERYQGFAYLKKEVIPTDAKRGWFTGIDGRSVRIPGNTKSERQHLCMSGYLQNGEAIVMKKATVKWHDSLKDHKALLVDLVHDEWQTEVPNNMEIALHIAKIQADSLREVGEELGLKCPLAGSYWNEDHKDYTIGKDWSWTH